MGKMGEGGKGKYRLLVTEDISHREGGGNEKDNPRSRASDTVRTVCGDDSRVGGEHSRV